MTRFWLRALEEAERAELEARRLRAQFGREAETRCLEELRTFSDKDPKRREVEDVQRALRWT